MRITKVLREILGLTKDVVVSRFELVGEDGESRPTLKVWVRQRAGRKGRCGACGRKAPWFDRGGGERTWRHLDVGFARCVLVSETRRVSCSEHGPTVQEVPWARHDNAFTRLFEDLVVWSALSLCKDAAAQRYDVTWRAVDNACERVCMEALGRTDLVDGLIAVGIDEVKYKKGQRYLTVVTDHVQGRVVWAGEGRSKATVREFFTLLGPGRAAQLQIVTCDGAEWIHAVVKERAPEATICMDTFHVIGWATDAVDEVRREEWNTLRRSNNANKAKQVKGLRWLLLRNWENLTPGQKDVLRSLETANRRIHRAWRLKEELRDIFSMGYIEARSALDDWLAWASRSKLPAFVKLARSIRTYRTQIEATLEWRLTNAIAESANAKIGRIRQNAFGFHTAEKLITMIMLAQPGIAPTLPWQNP